ncbi:energy-coupling factor transporter transmembrane protein EcfT, partial [Staphylococcus aureus]
YRQLKWQLRDTISLTMIIPIAIILFVLKYSGV